MDENDDVTRPDGWSRRSFWGSGALVPLAAGVLGGTVVPAEAAATPAGSSVAMTLTVNGQPRRFAAQPRATLLDALREHLQLTGAKKGCDYGQCGACTVIAGERRINSCLIADFYRLPGDTPHIDTDLRPGELITAVTLPRPLGGKQIYAEVRDRASYVFATVSVAAMMLPDGHNRFAFGALAHKSWRVEAAERADGPAAVAGAVLAVARTMPQNAFKVPLLAQTLASVVAQAKA